MQTIVRLQAICLVLILTLGSVAAPASAQDSVQDPKQPSVDNPHMHFWGDSSLNNCWTHFDENDSAGSSPEGYGEETYSQGQQVEIDYTCRVQENFKQDMYLDGNGTILIELVFQIYSADCTEQSECKDLTLTLYRGTVEVARSVTPVSSVNNGDDETIRWEIRTNESMERWNKSGEEPSIRVEYSAPGESGFGCGLIFDCDGQFRMYYSNNEDNASVVANFPVINASATGGGGGGGGIVDRVDAALPGFGLAAGLGALALAAVAGSTARRRDE
jgi:hypothetical protein